jgi:hypothetical protein
MSTERNKIKNGQRAILAVGPFTYIAEGIPYMIVMTSAS